MITALWIAAVWVAASVIGTVLLGIRLMANPREEDELAQFSHRWVERS